MESHNDRHPTEIAVLRGARMALCSEVDSGRRWNETRVKRLSGGDSITARLIARDPFEFQPSHKLVLLANAKPGIRVVDEAIRRRIHLIEFSVTIPEAERDTSLPEKLKAEAGGILAWAVAGCLDWQAGGLQPPNSILAATATYLDREDVIAEWVSECCRPLGQISLSDAHASYREWAERNGHPVIGRNTFGDQLEAHGIQRVEIRSRVSVFSGLSVVSHREKRHAG
jgi:putative DNA primase/helicase